MNTPKDILIVDDDPDLSDVMELALREAGYATRSARNGKEALDEVEANAPAVVLLDMLMPVMDGWQCARELRLRYGRTVPIVVVTAAEHVRSRGDEIGADDVLAKPFALDGLLSVVKRHAVPAAGATP